MNLARKIARMYIRAQEEEEQSTSNKGVSGKFLEFLEDTDSQRVVNPDSGQKVKIKSLKGPKGKKLQRKLFEEWMGKDKEKKPSKRSPPSEDSKQTKKPPKAEPASPSKTKDDSKTTPEKGSRTLKVKSNVDSGFIEKLFGREISEQEVAQLCGAQGLGEGYSVSLTRNGDDLILEASGPELEHMERRITSINGKPALINEQVILYDDAPKGLGTKMFASQVEAAKAMGLSTIKTHAAKSDTMVGYYVWARLGYHGAISPKVQTKMFKDIESGKLPPSFYAVFDVYHLMLTKEGRDWWKENGDGFDATFNLSGDSYDVLQDYMRQKKDKKASKSKTERTMIDDLDEAALDKVWDSRSKEWDALVKEHKERAKKVASLWGGTV